jgi:hypothetical protein
MFWCAVAKMLERTLNFLLNLARVEAKLKKMLVQIYRDNVIKKIAVYKWVTRFSEVRESATEEERSGRQAMSRTEENIANLHQIVDENHRLTVRSIARQENINRRVRKILT